MAEEAAIDEFLDSIAAINSTFVPSTQPNLSEHLVFQSVGNHGEWNIHITNPEANLQIPRQTSSLDTNTMFDPEEEMKSFQKCLEPVVAHHALCTIRSLVILHKYFIRTLILTNFEDSREFSDKIRTLEADLSAQFYDIPLSEPTHDLDLVFDFTTGKMLGVKEVASGTAKAEGSSSLQRQFSSMKDFVRGSSSNAPFLPGGVVKQDGNHKKFAKRHHRDLNSYMNVESSELFKPASGPIFFPGDHYGIQFDQISGLIQMVSKSKDAESIATSIETNQRLEDAIPATSPSSVLEPTSSRDAHYFRQLQRERMNESTLRGAKLSSIRERVQQDSDLFSSGQLDKEDEETEVKIHKLKSLKSSVNAAKQASKTTNAASSSWAILERMPNIMTDFEELVPDPAIVYPFEMDDFQKEAAYHLEQGESVFIAAHTSAGKTVVAEYAIALAMKHMTRAIYTSPIKALSNQKYRDFRDTFGEDVGLITGDVSVRSNATCLIVTTEILRSMLYKGADIIRDVEWVIFDEVHYINDRDRGVVWEEVIIMLPDHVGLIFLSATVPNTFEFADWVGRTKRKKVFVIKTEKRPVPLEHYLYYDKQLYKICDAKEYIPGGHAAVMAAVKEKSQKRAEKKSKLPAARSGGASTRRPKFGSQRGEWSKIVAMLSKRQLLPAVAFVFSKQKCMSLAQSLTHVDFTTKEEKNEIKIFITESIKRLKGTDRDLPQVTVMAELLSRGIGVHHSGLLPIIKEIVEILFSTGLIKLLFATETFAMGLNMPTRTVVFHSTSKTAGTTTRSLLPGEYIQMSGRAGRRGLDTVGTVIIACFDEAPESSGLRTIVTGKATKLTSQFRLTYNMILNLFKLGGDFKVEDMIKRSFFESNNQKDSLELKSKLKAAKEMAQAIEEITCLLPPHDSNSIPPIVPYHQLIVDERNLVGRLQAWLTASTYINELYPVGRVIVVNVKGLPSNAFGVVIRPPGTVKPPKKASSFMMEEDDPSPSTTVVRAMILTGSPSTSLNDQYKVITIDTTSKDLTILTQKKLKSVDHERIDLVPDARHIAGLIKELDDFKLSYHPGLPPPLDPIKHLKIKDAAFVEMTEELIFIRQEIQNSPCHSCPHLQKHLRIQDFNYRLREQVSALEFLLSDENLVMAPEYETRVKVLKHLDFLNSEGVVQLKGRVARELNNCDELIATEIIFENLLTDLEPAEVASLLSCFVFQEKSDSEPELPNHLKASFNSLSKLSTRLGELQADLGVPITPEAFVEESINPGLMEVVYEWACNKPFHDIVKLTDVPEGSIVRTIVRLDETLRDFRSAAKLIGDYQLSRKVEDASHLIKRDIVFASSLYIADAPQQQQQRHREASDGSALADIDDV